MNELSIELTPRCTCGTDIGITGILVTSSKQICFMGVCPKCRTLVRTTMPLSELYKLGLKLETAKAKQPNRLVPPLRKDTSKEDAQFLKELGIKA
jgi:hypothetical protein